MEPRRIAAERSSGNLKPGDTLRLAPGTYSRLYINGLNGKPGRLDHHQRTGIRSSRRHRRGGRFQYCGDHEQQPRGDRNPAHRQPRHPGAFGISARGHEENLTHDIRIEGNTFVGQNNGQQTDAISTKTPTWGWIIRYNRIFGAGTGLYLGESDGTQPFIGGLIEHNLIQNTIHSSRTCKSRIRSDSGRSRACPY